MEPGKQNATLRRIHYALLSLIAAACTLFVLYWFLAPDPKLQDHMDEKYTEKINNRIKSRFFRTDSYYGSVLIFQALPLTVVAILGYAVIFLRERIKDTSGAAVGEGRTKNLRLRLGTFPLWVKSPLGVLTGTDVLLIASFLCIMLYNLGRTLHIEFEFLEMEYAAHPEEYETSLALAKLSHASYYIGAVSNLPFSLLWIPVSRGSSFLRLVRVPYEHAVKYHIWLGVLTLFTLTVHSIGYTIYYVGAHEAQEIIGWDSTGETCAVVAGVVALAAGLVMWITSLSYFRRKWYEVFFAVHHLYIVFLLFWIYHVVWTVHFFSVPVLLFIVDRFLRFVQSRHAVNVLSAKVLESGAMELRFPLSNYSRKGRLQPVYQALSSWYLKFPGLPRVSGQQWHALSVMSTPMDKKPEMSIVIKPLGGWTNNLQDRLMTMSKQNREVGVTKCPFAFNAGVEGPYGDESEFYLKYKALVLVGGGIGVTPLLAILQDILHRYRLEQQSRKSQNNLPTSIHLYHCVRKTEELCVLNSVNPLDILPQHKNLGLDVQVHAFVTSPNPEDEENAAAKSGSKTSQIGSSSQLKGPETYDLAACGGVPSSENAVAKRSTLEFAGRFRVNGVSPVSPTGQTIWVASVAVASIIGFYVLWGLSNVLWVKDAEDKFPNYSRTHLILACMLLGTGVFGGAVIAGWYHYSYVQRRRHGGISKVNKSSNSNSPERELQEVVDEEGGSGPHVGSPWIGTLHFGRRPSWQEVFTGLTTQFSGQNVGVLVSGSSSMLEDVASNCKKYTAVNFQTLVGSAKSEGVVFHFHSVSFEL